MKILTALLATLSISCSCVLASTAGAADAANATSDRACLFAIQPQSWRVLDASHLVLWGPSQKDAYLVTLFSPLHDMNFSESLAFIDGDHDGMICGDGGDKIAVPDSHGASFPASITSMRRVSEAELVTLGEQYKVKLVSDKKAQQIKNHDKQVPATPADAKTQ